MISLVFSSKGLKDVGKYRQPQAGLFL